MQKSYYLLIAFILISCGIFLPSGASAAIKLPALIGNNMVLQQNATINVWGWADAGEKISIQASWLSTPALATTTADGDWKSVINTPKAGGPYTMTITGHDYTITIENIMIGEVWVCSGQSNMDFTLRGLGGWKLYPPEVRKDVKNHPGVRLFTVQKDTSALPLNNCKGKWKTADTGSVNDFSATAWFFGSYLSEKLDVPVGLIVSAWGGTPAEVWTPVADIKAVPDLGFYLNHYNGTQWWPGTAGVLYNSMIYPLLNYTIKGAIWYQGESNRMDAKLYPTLMNTLITSWRKNWLVGDFPFYYVQIAPFTYGEPYSGALLREAQLKCLLTPNTGMAVTMDLVDNIADIHPKNKLDVGKRLALWALNQTYGKSDGSFSGPIYKDFKTENGSIILGFIHADAGLRLSETGKNNFSIAGADHVFYPATVKSEGNSLVVSSPKVPQPQAVRYAFSNTAEATLFNGEGLPASSFRTDTWDIIIDKAILKTYFDPKTKTLSYMLSSNARESDIYYDFNKIPGKSSPLYLNPIPVGKTGTLYATVSRNGYLAEAADSWKVIANKASGAEITYTSSFSPEYTASGEFALVDGIMATNNYQDGNWQGFEGNNLEVVIDLAKTIKVKSIGCRFLSDNHSYIFLPKLVTVQVSEDGISYKPIGERMFSSDKEVKGASVEVARFPVKGKIRFIKLTALNQGICPAWHVGAGKKCWLFADEIVVE
jgi:sialate O-acetylesterase